VAAWQPKREWLQLRMHACACSTQSVLYAASCALILAAWLCTCVCICTCACRPSWRTGSRSPTSRPRGCGQVSRGRGHHEVEPSACKRLRSLHLALVGTLARTCPLNKQLALACGPIWLISKPASSLSIARSTVAKACKSPHLNSWRSHGAVARCPNNLRQPHPAPLF